LEAKILRDEDAMDGNKRNIFSVSFFYDEEDKCDGKGANDAHHSGHQRFDIRVPIRRDEPGTGGVKKS